MYKYEEVEGKYNVFDDFFVVSQIYIEEKDMKL